MTSQSPANDADGSSDDLRAAAQLREIAAERLLAVAAPERGLVLAELIAAHRAHVGMLEALARDLDGAERLLDRLFVDDPAAPPRATGPGELPATIGPYRVLRVIGEGGFGVVHLCAQDEPVRREVAVKVLRPGVGDRQTLARFEAERHVLATLQHAAIAKVFDAGALPDGRPYFVMEYVRGAPITAYCAQRDLDVDHRLALFARVCHAVQHAHDHGILHRDLKPANVLAFEEDGRPQPKIIDFGIAKALRQTEAETEVRTETGRVVGTPGYMSPEQAAGSGVRLDARADVFSLGVLLHELLTGVLPWRRGEPPTDTEPLLASVAVARSRDATPVSDKATPRRRLAARLRGDLDWIVRKAIERDRELRYASARALATDIEHHLRGKPVLARPPSLRYRMRKLVRRHRAAFVASAAVVVVVAVALWAVLESRAAARARTADLVAAANVLRDRARDPGTASAPRSDVVRKALAEDAVALYEKLLLDRPDEPELRESRARALWTLSHVQWKVGEFAKSETAARASVDEARALATAAPDNVVYRGILGNGLRNVGRALFSAGQVAAAREQFGLAVDELERCHATAPDRYADLLVGALLELGSAVPESELPMRRDLLQRAAAIQTSSVAARPTDTSVKRDLVDVQCALGGALAALGELDAAAAAFGVATETLAAIPDAPPAYACKVHHAAHGLAAQRGDHAGAVVSLRRAIAAAEQWRADEPEQKEPLSAVIVMHGELAELHRALGDDGAAAEAFRKAIAGGEIEIASRPDDAMARGRLAFQCSGLVRTLLANGRRAPLAEAEDLAKRANALLAAVPDSVDAGLRGIARVTFALDHACVVAARGVESPAAAWQSCREAMAAWRGAFDVGAAEADLFVAAALRLATHDVAAGAADAAHASLDEADALLARHADAITRCGPSKAESHRLRARLAAAAGDAARCRAAAAAAFAADPGWYGAMAGAEALDGAWRVTRAAADRDAALARHSAAIDAVRSELREHEDDVHLLLALGQALVRRAELRLDRGDSTDAQRDLAEAIPLLTALRDEVHADRFDEALLRRAIAIGAR